MEDYQTQKSKLDAIAETYQDKVKLLSEQIELELRTNEDDSETEITASRLDDVK